jgi:hypothetical protein
MEGNRMTQASKRTRGWLFGTLSAAAVYLLLPMAQSAGQGGDEKPTLEETRLTMGKWIETQQILAASATTGSRARRSCSGASSW